MHGIGGQASQMAATSFEETAKEVADAGRKPGVAWSQLRTGLIVAAALSALAACSTAPQEQQSKFSPKKYGVKGSPRVVADGQPVPKGGGRYVVGKKYKIAGKWYYPELDQDYKKTGLASWYGPTFHGRKTANGEVFDRNSISAAHTTMPLPSYARVTNLSNGRSMIVRVNDRGPFHGNRVIDLSERAATMLGTKQAGVGKVKVEYVGKAPLHGQDEAFLMASYRGPDAVEPGASRPGTLIAQAAQPTPQVVFGNVPTPGPRPYFSAAPDITARQQIPASLTVAFDPAIAFESGAPTIKVASNNRFVPSENAFAPVPTQGTRGVLPMPSAGIPTGLTSGSAVSSYSANKRISDAYSVLAAATGSGMSLKQLASIAVID